MKIKSNSRKERIAELETLKENLTYTAYITKENKTIIDSLQLELKDTNESIRELSSFINEEQKKGTDVSEFIKGFHELHEKQQKLEKELEQASIDTQVDASLLIIAKQLDRLEIDQKNIDDIKEVSNKVGEILNILAKVCKRSGGWYYAPGMAEQLYRQLEGYSNSIHHGVIMTGERSKDKLLDSLINRMDELDSKKNQFQSLLDKYKALLRKK